MLPRAQPTAGRAHRRSGRGRVTRPATTLAGRPRWAGADGRPSRLAAGRGRDRAGCRRGPMATARVVRVPVTGGPGGRVLTGGLGSWSRARGDGNGARAAPPSSPRLRRGAPLGQVSSPRPGPPAGRPDRPARRGRLRPTWPSPAASWPSAAGERSHAGWEGGREGRAPGAGGRGGSHRVGHRHLGALAGLNTLALVTDGDGGRRRPCGPGSGGVGSRPRAPSQAPEGPGPPPRASSTASSTLDLHRTPAWAACAAGC